MKKTLVVLIGENQSAGVKKEQYYTHNSTMCKVIDVFNMLNKKLAVISFPFLKLLTE